MATNIESTIRNDKELRIVMVGKTGVGKSATGNTLLGRPCFDSRFAAESLTVDCAKGKCVVDQQNLFVIDTPGLFDTRFDDAKTTSDLKQCVKFAAPGPHIFLVVIRLGRFTDEEKQTVQKVQEMFGESADRYSMVLFTGADQLECKFKKFLEDSKSLQELVAKCNGNYHVFNNKSKDRTQVTELLVKIRNVVQKNGGSHYTNKMFQEAERAIEMEKQRILKENEEKIRREREKMEMEIQKIYQEKMEKMVKAFQAERERERKEREEERRRERQEMIEERKREMAEMHEERRREREEKQREMTMMMNTMTEQHERQMKEEKRRFQEQKEEEARWRAEREEDLRKERQEMKEERKREMAQMHEDRRREREEQERQMNMMVGEMREQHERQMEIERQKLQEQKAQEARLKAELAKRSTCVLS